MKSKATPIYWTVFFVGTLLVFAFVAYFYVEPREIVIDASQAKSIGAKIAENENTNSRLNLIRWREEGEFSVVGIVPFVWYPQNQNNMEMSFNDFLLYTAESHSLPDWLASVRFPPWVSRADFLLSEHDVFKNRLRNFLQNSMSEQVKFLIMKLEEKLPSIIKAVDNPFAKMHVYENFYHIAAQENGVYALLDYFVFMGDGVADNKRYNNQGWGLLQVLEYMNGKEDNLVLAFVKSADQLLERRVDNAPVDERQFLPQWRRRIQSYHNAVNGH